MLLLKQILNKLVVEIDRRFWSVLRLSERKTVQRYPDPLR